MAKAAAPYVHAKLASTEISVAKPPRDNRSIMEQWHELLRDIEAAGAIEITPDDPYYQLLGIANKPNGDGTKQ
jgi:hypothetical protein